MTVYAVRDAVARIELLGKLAVLWMNGSKVRRAALLLAEFTGVVGNLRGARFGRDSVRRTTATCCWCREGREPQQITLGGF
jgi:hypothetical protein